MRKFSEILTDFLDERNRLEGSYYDNKSLLSRTEGSIRLRELGEEMDEIFESLKEIKDETN